MVYWGVVLSVLMLSLTFYLVDRSTSAKIKVEVVEITVYKDTCMHGQIENIDYRTISSK